MGSTDTCSDRQEDESENSDSTTFNPTFELYACDVTGGTVTASLRVGTTVVATVTQDVTVSYPGSISISGLLSSISKGEDDSFSVSASSLDENTTYTVWVSTNNSDIGFNDTCTDRQEDETENSSSTSFDPTFELYACDVTGGTVTASLRVGTTVVATVTQNVTVNYPGSISISGLDSSMSKGESDSFSVSASSLDENTAYTVWVSTNNSDIGFNDTCTDRQEDESENSDSTTFNPTFTLYACDVTGGTVTASLRVGTALVATATQNVTVSEAETIEIFALGASMEEGGSNIFRVTVSRLDSSRSYSISATVSGNKIFLHDNCSQVSDSVNVDANSTDYSANFEVHGCNPGVGTVTVTLNGGNETKTASQDVIVFPTFSGPPTIAMSSDRTSIRSIYTLPTDSNFEYQLAVMRASDSSFSSTADIVHTAFQHSSPWTYTPTEPGWYKIAVRACTPTVECGPYYRSTGSLYKLVPPDALNLIPLPRRRARLDWVPPTVNIATARFTVELQAAGESWTSPRVENLGSGVTELLLDLDKILAAQNKGLSDSPFAYEVRIRATVPGATVVLDSQDGETITIIDSPIISINGDSSLPDGVHGPPIAKAEVKWTKPNDVEGYTLRWRKLGDDTSGKHHTDAEWSLDDSTHPSHFLGAESIDVPNQESFVVRAPIHSLEMGEIYAFQLNYTTSAGEVFSARDRYAWPSDRAAGDGERIASFPLNHPVASRTYNYRICEETFFPATRQEDWRNLINHALGQWQLATAGLVTMDFEEDPSDTSDNPRSLPCASYETIVPQALATANRLLRSHQGMLTEELLRSHLERLYGWTHFVYEDKQLNEIIMVDNADPNYIAIKHVQNFSELAKEIRLDNCAFEGNGACALRDSADPVIADILLTRSGFEDDGLVLPGGDRYLHPNDIAFNGCADTPAAGHFLAYAVLVHESGHALGIRETRNPLKDEPQNQTKIHLNDHPNVPGSTMNYDDRTSPSGSEGDQFDCSPHPLDVLAIYAMYQTD